MNKKILNLAIPNIISNITIPLIGIVDLAILGHLESEIYLGAVALGSMIFNTLYWSFSFLRMGTTGITAQAFGSRRFDDAIHTLSRALLVALFAGLALILLQLPIAKIAFYWLDGTAEVERFASEYFYIRIWAAPATISLFALNGWWTGMQNTKTPLVISLVVNMLNLCLNIIFIFVFGMKSDGVALGTVLAQYLGLGVSVVLLRRYYYKLFKYYYAKSVIQIDKLHQFFSVNANIFIRTMCLIFVFTFFTAKSASKGDTILVVNTLLLQFLFFYSYLMDGFAYAAEALTGRFIGASGKKQLGLVVRYLFGWGIAVSVLFTILYAFGSEWILSLMTSNIKILQQSEPYLVWVSLIPILSFASFLWDGIYIGATAAVAMRNSMLIATILIFIPAYIIATSHYENHGLWIAMLAFMLARGLVQTAIAKRVIFTNKI